MTGSHKGRREVGGDSICSCVAVLEVSGLRVAGGLVRPRILALEQELPRSDSPNWLTMV